MGWPISFRAAIASPTGKPRLVLRRYTWAGTPGRTTRRAFSSWHSGGVLGLSPSAGVSAASQSIGVPSWTSNRGTLRIGFGGQVQSEWLLRELPRGAVCRLQIEYDGVPTCDAWMGRVTNHSGIGPQAIVNAYDLLSAASSRSAFGGAGESELFFNCTADGHSAALTALWTSGSSTALTFGSPPPHERETGGTGAVLVTPASGADAFILTYTGKSGNQLTGVSTSGQFGTTSSNAAAGSTVQEICWIDDTPARAAAKILTSTGAGTNGVYDTLPASWGFAFPRGLLDGSGIVQADLDMSPASGTHNVRTVSTTAQAQGFSWLQSVLQQYGLWLTMRQGQVTARAAIDRWATVPTAALTIGTEHILRAAPVRSAYDASYPVEYSRVNTQIGIAPPVSSGSVLPATRPAAIQFTTDYGYQIYQNDAAIATRLNQRISSWLTRIPSVVDLRTTLIGAQLCPGDWVVLAHPGIWTQSNPTGGPVFAMVSAVSVDWQAGAVSLRLHIQHRAEDA